MMHRSRVNPLASGLVTAVVLLVVMTLIVITGIPAGPQIPLPWSQKMTFKVQLADADALAPHASVEIAGVKAGEVESVTAQGGLAVATLQIEKQYSAIRKDAVVYLRAHGLFGPKYIAIVPGSASSPALHDGDTVLASQTRQPVDLDAILQDLQKPEQQSIRTLFVQLGEAAAGQGQDVNHLIQAADSLTQVLDAPLKSLASVVPGCVPATAPSCKQLSDVLINDEAFNAYFAQTPLDQLVANSEQSWRAFAANADHISSLLVHADSALTSLDSALNGNAGNLASIIHSLGQQGGTIDKLNRFTYLISLFGANLTGKEVALGTNPADVNVTNDIVSAITNVASAFSYSDVCLPQTPTGPNDNHCSLSPDGRQHYLHVLPTNWPPRFGPNWRNCPNPDANFNCPSIALASTGYAPYPDEIAYGLGYLLAS